MILSLLYVILSGIALPIGGIQMQYLWRNQLGDVYSLGLGSAACLGAAAATMSGWCSLTVGSFICTLICTIVCFFVTLKVNTQKLITFGILFGTFIGSLGTIVVTNAPNGDLLKQYYLWGAANFRLEGVTTGDIIFSLILFVLGLAAALSQARLLTRHFQSETEISNLGKALLLLAIMCLVTSAVSICGPIGFISLGVPNLSRIICKSTDILPNHFWVVIIMLKLHPASFFGQFAEFLYKYVIVSFHKFLVVSAVSLLATLFLYVSVKSVLQLSSL